MKYLKQLFALLAVIALLATACGSSADDESATGTDDSASEAGDGSGVGTDDTGTADDEAAESGGDDDAMEDDGPATASGLGSDSFGPVTTVSGDMIVEAGTCGLNNGEAATGEPILLGAGATNVPGIDFTWGPKMASLYFDCVNENGGIHGRPIQYSFEEGAPDPALWQGIATKLVEEDGVVGLVGNFSLLDCDVNAQYYADNGFSPIVSGVSPSCFLNDTFSAVNMGPYYSSLGGAQAAVRAGAEGRLVMGTTDSPGADFIASAVEDMATLAGLEFESFIVPVPIADPAALAQQLVDAAGPGGGVVLNFTGPTAVPLLEAVSAQGLVDEVVWASSTPPNDPTVAAALADCCGTDWDGKFLINAEFDLLDSAGADAQLLRDLHGAADRDFPISSFAQMGYLNAKQATEALLRMGEGAEISAETVNAAFRSLTNFESDMLCKPWYFSNNLGTGNLSNNTARTVAPMGGEMVMVEDCFHLQETDTNPIAAIRAAEG